MGAGFIKLWKGYSLITGKQYQKPLTRDSRWESRDSKSPYLIFDNYRVAYIGKRCYNTVGSSENAATKKVVKFIKNNSCFNITCKFDWDLPSFKSLNSHAIIKQRIKQRNIKL